MSRFNLIDEKWIPVRFLARGLDELGIRDALLRAKEIEHIEDSSPLVVAALHRFLLAVLYRALNGPIDIDQAKILFDEGIPEEKISTYLNKWYERFWLFDDKYPFFQIPNYEPKEKNGKTQWRSWSAMAAEHNADNAKVLFDHTNIAVSGIIPLSLAARWLISCQTFALGGGNSDFKYTKSGPSAKAVMVLPIGKSLGDTLVHSLVPENREVLKGDIPVWEREPETIDELKRGIKRNISGFADLYSWRSRSIKFNPSQESNAIEELALASGVDCSSEEHVDPMLGYMINKKKGKIAIQFKERGIWRDFDSLLPDKSHLAPKVIEHATALTRHDIMRFPRSMVVLGQANIKAKIEFWRMERFILPEALAGDRDVRREIREILNECEEAAKSLWNGEEGLKACLSSSIGIYLKYLLSRGDKKGLVDSKQLFSDIKRLAKSVTAISWYWSTIEGLFHQILGEYNFDRDSEDIRSQWLSFVREALSTAWEQHCASVSMGDAWSIRALIKSEGPVLRKLKDLKKQIVELQP